LLTAINETLPDARPAFSSAFAMRVVMSSKLMICSLYEVAQNNSLPQKKRGRPMACPSFR
jgi:hypothetical protein